MSAITEALAEWSKLPIEKRELVMAQMIESGETLLPSIKRAREAGMNAIAAQWQLSADAFLAAAKVLAAFTRGEDSAEEP